jgi:DNA-binding ferritin-like protein
MNEIATLLRTAYLLKHNCHNLVSRLSFFADHEFLGDSYGMALKHYDSVIERMIGLGDIPNLVGLQVNAATKLQSIPIKYKDNNECFFAILGVNKTLISMIENNCKHEGISQGTIQMLGTIADELEIENYKIQQRLKK